MEPDSPVGTAVIQAMAFVNGSNTRLTSNISYHMEAFPDDEQSLAEAKNWFGMDKRTGVVRLLRSAARPAEITARHIRFTIAAREMDKSLESRAPAVVLFHRLTSNRSPAAFFVFNCGAINQFLETKPNRTSKLDGN